MMMMIESGVASNHIAGTGRICIWMYPNHVQGECTVIFETITFLIPKHFKTVTVTIIK